EQEISVARRRDEVDPEPLAVVDRAHESGDLDLAPVARSGVHLAHGQRAAEKPAGARVDFAKQVDDTILPWSEGLRREPDLQHLPEEQHQNTRRGAPPPFPTSRRSRFRGQRPRSNRNTERSAVWIRSMRADFLAWP